MKKHITGLLVLLFTNLNLTQGQFKTSYPDIPRIDVHAHFAEEADGIDKCLDLRKKLKKRSGINLAMWLNLGTSKKPITDNSKMAQWSNGRIACAIADYTAHNGLEIAPEALKEYKKQGYVGYKIWSGPWYRVLKNKEDGYPYINDPAHSPTFTEMEKIDFPGASVHIADPNGPYGKRTPWLADPVEYWKEILAWTDVLKKHPDLKAVMAHANWLICQDAQIDFLRYLLATYPNLHLDLGATFQYYNLVNPDNLRSFMIEWADRILYATDISSWENDAQTDERIQQYLNTFEILETDHLVAGSFFSDAPIQGLNLPKEVLEKIYYKNALKIYPQMKKSMEALED